MIADKPQKPKRSRSASGDAPTRTAKRVTLQYGTTKRKLLLVDPPYPERGEILTIEGQNWLVKKITDEKVIFEFTTEGGKLRQVFP